jgi:restriction endonuclease S subunit
MRLRQLCKIHSGYTARGRLEAVAGKGAPAIQLRDVTAEHEYLAPPFHRYQLGDLSARHLVMGGDVVFRSRGQPNTAAVVSREVTEPVTVVVPLVILRPNQKKVLPEYLAWSINQPDAQRRLDASAQGTSIRMIPMAELEQLEISLPDLETQRLIVELHKLATQEARLLRELATRREQRTTLLIGEVAARADQHKSKS